MHRPADIVEARRRLAEHPPQDDPTAVAGETLDEKAGRLGAVEPAVTTTTEYGYTTEFPDGSRDWITGLGTDRDRALGQFGTLERDDTMRLVFVSRRVTEWADVKPEPGGSA